MFRMPRPLREPLSVMRQTFLRTLVRRPWRRPSWADSATDCRPRASEPVVSSNILFTSFRVGLPEAACSTPLLLVYSLGRRSRIREGRNECGDLSIPSLENRTAGQVVTLAVHFDELHVVFPSSISAPQHPDKRPGLCYGNPHIRGAMRDEHLAPYGSAARQQIPPTFEGISPLEEVEQVAHFRRPCPAEALERGKRGKGDHTVTRTHGRRSEGQEGAVALAVQDDPPSLGRETVDHGGDGFDVDLA